MLNNGSLLLWADLVTLPRTLVTTSHHTRLTVYNVFKIYIKKHLSELCWFEIKFDQKYATNVDFIIEEPHVF